MNFWEKLYFFFFILVRQKLLNLWLFLYYIYDYSYNEVLPCGTLLEWFAFSFCLFFLLHFRPKFALINFNYSIFPSNISNKLSFLIYYFNSLLILSKCPTYYILSIHSQDFSSPYQNKKWLTILPLFTFPLNHIHHFGPPLTLSFWALPLLIKTFYACPFGIKSHSFVFYLFIYRFPILSPPLQKSPKYKQSWKVPLRWVLPFLFSPPSSLVCLVQIAFSPIMQKIKCLILTL